MATLVLNFASGAGYELIQTEYKQDDGSFYRSTRGKSSGAYFDWNTFQWTSAVKALASLFIKAVLCERGVLNEGFISENKGSLVASLDYAMSKETTWLVEMFGCLLCGRPAAKRLLLVSNPNRKRAGPVVISWNSRFFPLTEAEIFLDTKPLRSAEALQDLLSKIEARSDRNIEGAEQAGPGSQLRGESAPVESRLLPHVAYVCPAIDGKFFYNEALESFILASRFRSAARFQLVPKLPSTNYSSSEMKSLIETLVEDTSALRGLILVADDPIERLKDILHLRQKTGLKIVLFDIDIDRTGAEPDLAQIPFVGGDEMAGGALAAKALVEHFIAAAVTNPRVLVLRGATSGFEARRFGAFKQALLSGFPSASIFETPPAQYDKALARYASLEILLEMVKEDTILIDGCFACNDDMALGARSAVLRARKFGKKTLPHFGIVGYDGVREVRDLIDDGDDLMIASVDVKISEQVNLCVQAMARLLSDPGAAIPVRTIVKPRLYGRRLR